MTVRPLAKRLAAVVTGCAVLAAVGCTSSKQAIPADPQLPHELNKVTLPEYLIEPPDVLQIDLVAIVPKPPIKLQPLDVVSVRIGGVQPPVAGVFQIDPEGKIDLGLVDAPGPDQVAGMTVGEAQAAVEARLGKVFNKPGVNLSLAQGRAVQQVRGPHLVRPDGTIGLGSYGSVRVVGQTLTQAKQSVEAHLGQYFQGPEISLDVTGYNSKVYYVIFDGGGAGQQMVRLPVTGNETVLDAIGQLGGLSSIANPQRIWISRPAPSEQCQTQVMPIDWKAITECADTRTNYQLLPGDRIFVNAAPMVTVETRLSRALAPVERVLGFTLLGVGTARSFTNFNNNNGVGGF